MGAKIKILGRADELLSIPLASCQIRAGFPSPAEDFREDELDVNHLIIKNKLATFFVKVEGTSMEDVQIEDGDILIVDRSLEPTNGKIAVCVIDGEFTVKILRKKWGKLYLEGANKEFKPIPISEFNSFQVWGMVTYNIKKLY